MSFLNSNGQYLQLVTDNVLKQSFSPSDVEISDTNMRGSGSNEVRSLTTDSSVYILSGTAVTAATAFLLIPMLIRFLPPVDYGVISIVTVTASGWCLILNLGMNGAISQSFHGFKEDPESSKDFIGSVFFFVASFWLLLLTIVFLIKSLSIFSFSSREWLFMIMSILLGGSDSLLSITATVLKIQSKAKQFAMVSILRSISLILIIAFLAFNDRLIDETKLIGDIIASFIAVAFSILLIIKSLSFRITKEHLSYALDFGIPSLPHHVSTLVLMSGDRYIVKLLLGTSAVGVYTLGYQLAIGIHILTIGFDNAWNPYFFEKAHRGEKATRRLRPVVKMYSSSISLLTMVYVAFISFVGVYFISEEYSGAYDVIPVVSMGLAFQGFYFLTVKPILFQKKTGLLSVITSSAAILNIALNLILIPYVGIIGAAIATYLSYMLQCIVTSLLSSRYASIISSPIFPIRDFTVMTVGVLAFQFIEEQITSISIFVICLSFLLLATVRNSKEVFSVPQ